MVLYRWLLKPSCACTCSLSPLPCCFHPLSDCVYNSAALFVVFNLPCEFVKLLLLRNLRSSLKTTVSAWGFSLGLVHIRRAVHGTSRHETSRLAKPVPRDDKSRNCEKLAFPRFLSPPLHSTLNENAFIVPQVVDSETVFC